MSLLRNLLGNFMPHFEARRTTGTLAAVNSEVVHDLNGDASAVIYLNGTGTLNASYAVDGSVDGVNYFPLICYPYATGSVGGTLPIAAQPLVLESVNAATVQRVLCASVGGLQKIRVRLLVYTSGSCAVTINSDDCISLNPFVNGCNAGTHMVSATAATGAGVTASLPAVGSMRHYVQRIDVTRSATAALGPLATPILVTTVNIPGLPSLTFGVNGAMGDDRTVSLDFGEAGMASTTPATQTAVVCPAVTGVIWRVNVAYRLGL